MHLGSTGQGAEAGDPFAGGGQAEIAAGKTDPGIPGDGADQHDFIAFPVDGNAGIADFHIRFPGGGADADHVNAAGGQAAVSQQEFDAVPGAAAAADADDFVPGGIDADRSGGVQRDGTVGIIVIGADADGIVPVVMHIQLAGALDDQGGGTRHADPFLGQGILAFQDQREAAVAAQLDGRFHGTFHVDLVQCDDSVGTVIDAEHHVDTLGLDAGEGEGNGSGLEAGDLFQCHIQQVDGFAVLQGMQDGLAVIAGRTEVFLQNFVANLFADRPERLLCRPAGVVSLDQVDAAVDDRPKLFGRFHPFRQRADSVLMRKINRVFDKQPAVGIPGDAGNQRPVDFDDMRGIPEQVDDIAVAGAVVINGDLGLAARLAQTFHPLQFLI